MKLYYKINRIASAADKIIVKSYNNNVFEFNKKDFGENWEQLVNKEYELSPYAASNLDKLQLEGEESHAIEYSEENKNNWFQYSRNMIRDDFFYNKERMIEVDASRIVKIFNKEAIANSTQYFNIMIHANNSIGIHLTKMANNALIEKVKVDFSNIKISESFKDTSPLSYMSARLSNISVVKLPPIPKSFTSLLYNNTSKCLYEYLRSDVEDISNLDTSNIINFSYAFCRFTNIEDFSNIKTQNGSNFMNAFYESGAKKIVPMTDSFFPKVEDMSQMYYGCKNLESIDKINISANVNLRYAFAKCSNLKQVGNINLPNTTNASYMFYYCPNAEIGNVYVPNSAWTIFGKKEGNITAKQIIYGKVESRYSYQTEEVGIINCTNFAYDKDNSGVNNFPLKVKAISNKTLYIPSSSGYEWWIDFIPSPTSYAKSILTTTGITPVHIKTPTKNARVTIEFPLFNVNKAYPYTFELKTSDLLSFTPSSCKLYDNNVLDKAHSASNCSVTYNEESTKYLLSFDINDVYDGYSPILKVVMPSVSVTYTALIDGYSFTSKITFSDSIIYSIPLTFEVDEDISVSTRVEYDEDEISNEETAEESTEEEIVSDPIQETTEEDVSDSQTSTVVEEANTEN